MREALKMVAEVVLFLARLIVLAVRVGVRYAYLRVKLAAWRRLSQWRLERKLRGMPPSLRRELVDDYKAYTARLLERFSTSIGSIRGKRRHATSSRRRA